MSSSYEKNEMPQTEFSGGTARGKPKRGPGPYGSSSPKRRSDSWYENRRATPLRESDTPTYGRSNSSGTMWGSSGNVSRAPSGDTYNRLDSPTDIGKARARYGETEWKQFPSPSSSPIGQDGSRENVFTAYSPKVGEYRKQARRAEGLSTDNIYTRPTTQDRGATTYSDPFGRGSGAEPLSDTWNDTGVNPYAMQGQASDRPAPYMRDPNADPTTTLNEAQPTNVFADPFGNDNYEPDLEAQGRNDERFYESQTARAGLADPFGNDMYRPDSFYGPQGAPGSMENADFYRRQGQSSYRDVGYNKPPEQADYDRFDAFIEERRERSRRAAEAEAQRVRESAPQARRFMASVPKYAGGY
jgi:hypothetical protein